MGKLGLCGALVLLAGCACGDRPPSNTCDVACTQVPASECVDTSTLRTYSPVCSNGCTYPAADRKCDRGCADGRCNPSIVDAGIEVDAGVEADAGTATDAGTDACMGISCNLAPASVCLNATTLKIFDTPGSCAAGQCQYASHTEACANGCANGQCTGSPCQGVTCNAPPAATCLDASTLTTYAAAGTCTAGTCAYAPGSTTCAFGCANGQCTNDPCAGKTCNQPPAAYCASATTRRSFTPAGTCAGGSCTYASADTTCPFGCANGVCNGDPCMGVACTMPPAAFCSSATALRSFSTSGTCAQGACTYAPSDVTCPFGCGNGACLGDPCATTTCTTPPAAVCVGNSARSFSAAGTCSSGACTYASVDVACANGCSAGLCNGPTCNGVNCNTPPAATCTTSTRLKSYARLGTCVTSACSYQAINIDCSQGCFNGACIAGSWQLEAPPLPVALDKMSVAFDAASTPVISGCAPSTYDLVFRSRNDFGWFDETVDPGLGAQCYSTIAVDAAGPAIAYFDAVNKDLRFARRVNGVWSLKELVTTAGDVGRGASLTFDPANGQAIVSYYDFTSSELRVARRTGTNTWTTELALSAVSFSITGAATVSTSVRFDAQGNLHAAAGQLNSVGSNLGTVYLARKAAGTWSGASVANFGTVPHSAIGVASNGEVRFLWSYTTANVRTRSALGVIDEKTMSIDGRVGLVAPLDGNPMPFVLQSGVLTGSSSPVGSMVNPVNGFWRTAALPFTATVLGYLHDGRLAPDGRTQAVAANGLLSSPNQCVPACSGKTCGDDGCGGVCGACTSTQGCSPVGTCVAWAGETIRGMQVTGAEASLAFGPSGAVHAMVGPGSSQYSAHQYLQRTATGWTPPELVSSTMVSSRQGFAVNGSGLPLLAYDDTAFGIRTRSSAAWPKSEAGTDYGSRPDLLVDAAGVQRLVRAKLTSPTYELELWTNGAGGWAKVSIVSGTGSAGVHSSAMDGQGALHVLFIESQNGTSATKLKYATNKSGAFVTEQVDAQSSMYNFIQLRVTAAGVPHIVFYPYLTGSYAVRGATAWAIEALPASLTLDASTSNEPRFGLDGTGIPTLVAPKLVSSAFVINFAQRTGAGAWAVSPVPTLAVGTGYPVRPELAFDAAGKPHVLVWDDLVLRHIYKP